MSGLDTDDRKNLLLSIGSHRGERRLSPLEVAAALQRGIDGGSSPSELASMLYLDDASMVARFLRLLTLSPEVRELVDWGPTTSMLPFTSASELARLPPGEDVALARAALEMKLSGAEIKQVVQLRIRSAKALDDCVDAIVRLRPQIERRFVFIGAVTAELADDVSGLVQAERDQFFRSLLAEWLPNTPVLGARLTQQRFTIVGDKTLADALSGRDFESEINSLLAR